MSTPRPILWLMTVTRRPFFLFAPTYTLHTAAGENDPGCSSRAQNAYKFDAGPAGGW